MENRHWSARTVKELPGRLLEATSNRCPREMIAAASAAQNPAYILTRFLFSWRSPQSAWRMRHGRADLSVMRTMRDQSDSSRKKKGVGESPA